MPRLLPVLLALSAALNAQQSPSRPTLLADVHGPAPAPGSSTPTDFVTVGGATCFVADDGVHGRELFRTLGSARTTALVADIAPGPAGSNIRHLTPAGGRLFFFADDGVVGREPWVTDGTPSNTHRITDLVPGPGSPSVIAAYALGDRVVFLAAADDRGLEPWVTDGTAAGTQRLADINPGPAGSVHAPLRAALVHADGGTPVLDFPAVAPHGHVWYRTDGTPAGTRQVAVLGDRSSVWSFGESGATGDGRVVFPGIAIAGSGTGERALWSTDGTAAGTTRIAVPTTNAILVGDVTAFDGRVFVFEDGDDLLLATDGTAAGTRRIPRPPGAAAYGRVRFLGTARGALWLMGSVGFTRSDLLRIDAGGAAATVVGSLPLADVESGIASFVELASGDRCFQNLDGALWAIDVAAVTATRLADTRTSAGASAIALTSGRLFFASHDPLAGLEPWTSDGSPHGTVRLLDLNTTPPSGMSALASDPLGFTRFRGRVLFGATTWEGPAIWETDGTPAGTRQVVLGPRVTGPMVDVGGRLAFAGQTAAQGRELWFTDGSPAGTALVQDLLPGIGAGLVADPVALGGDAVFVGDDAAGRRALRAADERGVRSLIEIPRTAQLLGGLHRLGDTVVALTSRFEPAPPRFVGELWATDGTVAGSRLVAVLPVQSPSVPAPVVFADRLWFAVETAADGTELYASDGTAAGTVRAGELAPGNTVVPIWSLTEAGGRLFAVGVDRLFVVDDVAAGPVEVALPPTTWLPWQAEACAAVGGRLLLIGQDAGRWALIVSDGTAAGTDAVVLPTDLVPDRTTLVPAGGRYAFFRVTDRTSGTASTWVTDGTSAGTREHGPLAILRTHAGSPTTAVPAPAGGLFYAAVDHPEAGVEPHVIDVGALAERLGHACGGAGRAPELRAATPPVLGTRCVLAGRAGTGALAVVLLGLAPLGPTAVPANGACALQVPATAFVDLPAITIVAGRFSSGLDIPADRSLTGLQIAVQALVGPTDAPLGVDLTNGLSLTLGQ